MKKQIIIILFLSTLVTTLCGQEIPIENLKAQLHTNTRHYSKTM